MAKKRLNSVVGIDIGSQNIKVAEIRNTGREVVVNALGVAPTPDNMVDHNGVYDEDSIATVIKQLCSSAGVSTKDAVYSIAGQASILVRTLEVPRQSTTELKAHMEWEIGRNQPFAETTVQSAYDFFEPEDPNATNMDVVMAIGAQSAVDTLMSIAKKSQRGAYAIDVEPLAIARNLKVTHDSPQDVVCFIEMGHKSTSINVYKDGQLLLPRQVPMGGDNFTQAIAGALNISVEDAEALKIAKSLIPDSAGTMQGDPFGMMNPFGDPNETQSFQPYNPFADDMLAAPVPTSDPTPEPTSGSAYGYNPFSSEADASAAPPTDAAAAGAYGYNPFGEADQAATPPSDDPYAQAPVDAPFESDANFATDSGADMPVVANAPASVASMDPESERVYTAISAELDEFASEVRRSIDYFRSKGGDVTRIYMGGGSSKMNGMIEYISRVTGISAELYDPLQGLPLAGKRLDMSMIDQHRADFTVAVGNGLHIVF
jgi:type IV pilus assembly protein PilM